MHLAAADGRTSQSASIFSSPACSTPATTMNRPTKKKMVIHSTSLKLSIRWRCVLGRAAEIDQEQQQRRRTARWCRPRGRGSAANTKRHDHQRDHHSDRRISGRSVMASRWSSAMHPRLGLGACVMDRPQISGWQGS
jgi:hypothetical protein